MKSNHRAKDHSVERILHPLDASISCLLFPQPTFPETESCPGTFYRTLKIRLKLTIRCAWSYSFQWHVPIDDRIFRHGLAGPVSNSIRSIERPRCYTKSLLNWDSLFYDSSSLCVLSSEQSQMIAVQPEIYLTSLCNSYIAQLGLDQSLDLLPSYCRNSTLLRSRLTVAFVEVPTAKVIQSLSYFAKICKF
jgi:hypothetical protein